MNHWFRRNRAILGWVVAGLPGLLNGMSAVCKLAHARPEVEAWRRAGLRDDLLTPMGLIELTAVALYLVPRTTSAGVLMLTAYIGGITLAFLNNGLPWPLPALMLTAVWLGSWLRNPETFASFTGSNGQQRGPETITRIEKEARS